MKILFFDLETTGIRYWRNGIHQISGEIVIDGECKESFNFHVRPNPQCDVDEEALKICHVTKEQIFAYPPMEEVYKQFTQMLSKYVDKYDRSDKFFLAGYNNASFDNYFLKAFFVQNGDNYFYSWFWVNSIDVMVLATQHLLDTGSKRVAFIGGANHLDIVTRRKHGYLEALRDNRIPIEKELVICRKIDYEEGKIATEALLSLPQPPDAILAMNDTLAFAAIEVIKSHGLRIPEDIAIIGYTDEQHANYVEPKLSAVSHQTYKMGETACRLLIDQIKGDRTVRQIIIPTNLQIRESSRKK